MIQYDVIVAFSAGLSFLSLCMMSLLFTWSTVKRFLDFLGGMSDNAVFVLHYSWLFTAGGLRVYANHIQSLWQGLILSAVQVAFCSALIDLRSASGCKLLQLSSLPQSDVIKCSHWSSDILIKLALSCEQASWLQLSNVMLYITIMAQSRGCALLHSNDTWLNRFLKKIPMSPTTL